MRWFVIVLILVLSFAGCNSKISDETALSMNQPLKSESELKKAVLYEGDIDAYESLSTAYLDYTIQEEFLLYAMIMANKRNYPQAYFDVFDCLTIVFSSDISQIDESTANLAVDYLLKASEIGHHQAKDMVKMFSLSKSRNSKEQLVQIFSEM